MRYTSEHKDTRLKILYLTLILISLVTITVRLERYTGILSSVALIFLVAGLYLFIRFEMTSYTYIIESRDDKLELFIDRAVGKRGAYVCYYPVQYAREIIEHKKGSIKELREKYKKLNVYKYYQNPFQKERVIIVFENEGYYDAVIIEKNEAFISYLKEATKEQK